MIYNEYTPLNSGAVAVPADFCGMAMHSWPSTGLAAGPINVPNNIRYKSTCTDDWQSQPNGIGFLSWSALETAAGVYDYSKMDVFVAGHASRGVSVTYQNLWMPAFYSTNPTQIFTGLNGDGQPHYGVGGPLNAAGKGIPPTPGVAAANGGLYNFVYNTILRYKNRGTPIKTWQTWVEPHWPITLGAGTWWGTQQELVDVAYWSYLAAKAADPNIVVQGPSVMDSGGLPSTSAWVDFTGAVNTTIRGHETFDEIGFDVFDVGPVAFQWGLDVTSLHYKMKNPVDIRSTVERLRSGMGANVKPIAFTNLGLHDNAGTLTMAEFARAQNAIWRKRWVARSLLTAAALGVLRCNMWNYDHYIWTGNSLNYYFLDFVSDTDGAVAGFNEIADNVVGKTITFCGYRGDGQMVAAFSDGSTYTI